MHDTGGRAMHRTIRTRNINGRGDVSPLKSERAGRCITSKRHDGRLMHDTGGMAMHRTRNINGRGDASPPKFTPRLPS